MSGSLLTVGTLCHREVVRFLRQRSRVVGALGQPLFFCCSVRSLRPPRRSRHCDTLRTLPRCSTV